MSDIFVFFSSNPGLLIFVIPLSFGVVLIIGMFVVSTSKSKRKFWRQIEAIDDAYPIRPHYQTMYKELLSHSRSNVAIEKQVDELAKTNEELKKFFENLDQDIEIAEVKKMILPLVTSLTHSVNFIKTQTTYSEQKGNVYPIHNNKKA